MTQVYDEAGQALPVTVVAAGPCDVLQVRTAHRDGYDAVQLGYLDKPRRLASRAQRGQVAKLDGKRSKKRAAAGIEPVPKAGCEPKRFVREIRPPDPGLTVGSQVTVEAFESVVAVDVIATSKGRGFSGAMKRHNFSGQRASHGVKKCHRHMGGTGCSAYPGRLFKGIRMPGQYGAKRCTVRNQMLVRIDSEENLLIIGGAIPGPNGGYVVVQQANKLGSGVRKPKEKSNDKK
ncbi:MAG: 50S ribosomal protein L3 [Pirellulales bacterium]|nr:50S ribosomal protein L3 [Pirellulales bacterium]